MASRSELWNVKDIAFSVDPQVALFNANGGKSEHFVSNTGDLRLAVKIRCSNNQIYRVHPVHFFLDAGKSQNIVVTRLPGEPRTDKLVVHFMAAEHGDTDVQALFKNCDKTKMDSIKIQLEVNKDAKSDTQKQ